MRTLHTVASLDNRMGGSVHAALNVCKYLVESGTGAEIAATWSPEDDLNYLDQHYSQLSRHLHSRCFPRHHFNSIQLRSWLRKNVSKYDLVELHGVFSFVPLYTYLACRAAKVPYLVRPHGSLDPFDLRKHRFLKNVYGPLFVRPMIKHAQAVLLTAELEAQRLETYGAHAKKLVAPLPVPQENMEGDAAWFRQQHRIPASSRIVLFLSRIDYKKGLEFLIPGLAGLKSEYPNLWFILAGTGEAGYLDFIQSMLAKHRMNEWTTACGFISGPAKAAAFAASEVFALPSLNENFGIVLVEAMRAGLALVISDQVYIHREIERAGAGLVCRTDVSSCKDALRRLLSGETPVRATGDRARMLAREKFSPETAIQRLQYVYKSLLTCQETVLC
jgi:glycosyltransferase involved in cell wall biosynthesis